MRSNRTFKMVVIANLAAISLLLYMLGSLDIFGFPMAPFLKFQFSNVPAIIGGFLFGPGAGVIVLVARTIIRLPFTSTAGVGELADLVIGIATVVVSATIYQKYHNKKGAILASVWGSVAWIVVAVAANWAFLLRAYVFFFFNGNVQPLLGMIRLSNITEDNYLWMFSLYIGVPFNLLLSAMVYGVTFLVYKRISELMKSLREQFE